VVSFSADGNGHAGILIGHTANHNTVTGGTISHTADAALWVHFAANDNLLENISISTAQNPSSYGIVLWNSRRNTFRNINIREYKTGALVRADDILTLLLPYGCAQPGPGGVPQLACSNGQPTNPSCYWACGYDDADTYGNVFDQLNVAYATPDLPDTVGIQLNTDTPNANLRKVRDNPITNLLVANTRYGLLHDEATPGTVLTHQATAPIGYWGYDHVWVPNNRVVKSYWDFTSAAVQHPNFPEAWGIDDNVATAWSSAMLTQFTSTYYAAWPSVYMNPVRRLNLFARLQANGQPQAFPKSYEVYITDPGNTQWNYVSTFSVQPDHGVASVTLGGPFQTWGVFIRATELTTDTFGNFYFQLADIEMQPW
jgi:hypothetical protein